MYKVMLIDDDVPVVEYIRLLIPWEELGLHVNAEAYSAEEAMERFEDTLPDILITDIGLPDGDGIELARRFRSIRPELRVIFLTCHEEFHYVKEALRIEADDYVVKDELDPDAMVDTLRRAAAKLTSEQERLEQLAYKSDLQRNRDAWLQQFFQELLHSSNPEELLSHGRRLGIDWSEVNCFAVTVFHLDIGDLVTVYNQEHTDLIHYAAYNIASELAAGRRITPFPSHERLLWVIACEDSPLEATASLERFTDCFQSKLQEYLKVRVHWASSGEACELADLVRCIDRTTRLFELGYYDESSGRLPVEDVSQITDEQLVQELESLCDKYVEALTSADRSLAHIFISNLEKTMRAAAYDPMKAKSWLMRCVQEASVRFDISGSSSLTEDIARTVRSDEAFRLMRWYTDRLIEHIRPFSLEEQMNPDLKAIHAFIYENIYQNISSIDIARYLHLNPSYFSRYFKKLTGLTFTDYVHLLKLEEAKRLLSRGETAEHTAYMLGYSDRAYFSRVFKKYTGISPSEHKPNSTKGDEHI